MRRLNRSKLETIKDILTVCGSGERRTHIMYQANLSFAGLNKFLGLLTDLKMIEKEFDKDQLCQVYRTTSKGGRFLIQWQVLQGFLEVQNE